MGGFIDKLTKSGLDYGSSASTEVPMHGVAAPKHRVKYYDSPDRALAAGNEALAQVPAPTLTATPAATATATPTTVPMPEGVAGPEELGAPNLTPIGGGATLTEPPQPALPTVTKPSFNEAATGANGLPAGDTPGLTRMGKLMQVLGLAAKGAMAGRAADEEVVARSGGHTSGGAGVGFMAGLNEPARELAIKQQTEHGGLQNQALRQSISLMPWHLKQQQAALEHTQASTEYMRAHAKYLGSMAAVRDKDKLTQMHADAVQQAISEGRDPQDDPIVQQYADAITSLQRAQASHNPTELSMWAAQHEGEPIENYFKMKHELSPGAETEYRDWVAERKANGESTSVTDYWHDRAANPKPPTRGQEAAAVTRQKAGFRRLESQFKYVPETGEYEDRKTSDRISAEEFTRRKQDIQDTYEEERAALTGEQPEHVEIPVADAQGKKKAAINPASPVATHGGGTAPLDLGPAPANAREGATGRLQSNGTPFVVKKGRLVAR